MAVIQRWPVYTVEPLYSGHPWDTTSTELATQSVDHYFVCKGFVNWMSYEDFIQRYHMLSPGHIPGSTPTQAREQTTDLLQSMKQLMEEVEVSDDHYGLGNNKVFLK